MFRHLLQYPEGRKAEHCLQSFGFDDKGLRLCCAGDTMTKNRRIRRMTQIERISHMEQILDETAEAAKNLSVALERLLAMKDGLS